VDESGSSPIYSNDNWMEGGQMLAITATEIPPALPQSSGLIVNLEPGAYSLEIADVTGNGGIGLGEIFEMVFKNIPSSLIAADDFETLVTALTAATPNTDLVTLLSGDGPFTVFAPTDAAFAKLPEGTIAGLLADLPTLVDILAYHVVAGEVPASAVTNTKLEMFNGESSIVQVTNAGGVVIQGANVDFKASNGVIHVIDSVIIPPSGQEDIVDVLLAAGNFNTLIQAAVDTGAAATLRTDGPFTLFAPTDDAFASLPEGLLASLSNEQLLDILLYHVISGAEVPAAEVNAGMVEAANGGMLTLGTVDGVQVNDANVILADLFGTNGVIHVIDKVLVPPSS
jgi:transforming growth factor-beta-induced protein